MDDVDAHEADATGTHEGAVPASMLTAGAFVTPWALLSFALPPDSRWRSLVLLALLFLLLTLAAIHTDRVARARRLDATWWSFLAVVTFGWAMLGAHLAQPQRRARGRYGELLCHDCGDLYDARQTFCYRCGAADAGRPATLADLI